jgi:hypothetical protein
MGRAALLLAVLVGVLQPQAVQRAKRQCRLVLLGLEVPLFM